MIRIIPAYNRTRVKKYYTACLNQARRPNQRLQEMIGHLRGNLAARLELERFPVQIVINYLADNFHPATDKQLTPRTKERGNKKRGKGGKRIGMRRVIFDSGFFLPKGVSLLGVLLDIREVVTLVVTASHETMLDIEKMAGTRMRLEGVLDGGRGTGELVWLDCTHYTSRPVDGISDPHLHIHNPIFNVTWDPIEGRFKAVDLEDVMNNRPMFQAAFHSRLAFGLTELGFEIERRGAWWDIAGISEELRSKFSRRAAFIQAHRAARGVTTSAGKSLSAVITRAQKAKGWMESLLPEWQDCLTREEQAALRAVEGKRRTDDTLDTLRAQWQTWLTPSQKEELERVAAKARARRLQPPASTPSMTAQEALDHVLIEVGHPLNRPTPRRDLVKALWYGLGKVGANALQEEVQRRLGTPPDTVVGSGVATTKVGRVIRDLHPTPSGLGAKSRPIDVEVTLKPTEIAGPDVIPPTKDPIPKHADVEPPPSPTSAPEAPTPAPADATPTIEDGTTMIEAEGAKENEENASPALDDVVCPPPPQSPEDFQPPPDADIKPDTEVNI